MPSLHSPSPKITNIRLLNFLSWQAFATPTAKEIPNPKLPAENSIPLSKLRCGCPCKVVPFVSKVVNKSSLINPAKFNAAK